MTGWKLNMEDKYRKVKKVIKWVLISLAIIACAFVAFLGVMTVFEYNPKPTESIELIEGSAERREELAPGDTLTLLTFNIGYAGLGEDQDFFMDGGEMVQPDSIEDVEKNLEGIIRIIKNNPADIYFLQEVDRDSKRSFGTDELLALHDAIGMDTAFALNYSSAFVPYPIPPIGKVNSGIATISALEVNRAQRISLPVPFKWPVRLFNLKRCLLAQRISLGSGAELVLVNLHLEAYDEGEGKEAQTLQLMDLLRKEYLDGNYVIAGGDFNQTFPGTGYPILDEDFWQPGKLEEDLLPDEFSYAADGSVPTSRLNNEPFSAEGKKQFYIIDGFIVSPNVEVLEVETLDENFIYSDHNPVRLVARLAEQAQQGN